jgi:hypothetical protein
MFSKFLLGNISVDDATKKALGRTPLDLIARHAVCEFGLVTPRQYKINLQSLEMADEIVSEFRVDPLTEDLGRVRITTVAGWGSTEVVWIKPQPKPKRRTHGLPV